MQPKNAVIVTMPGPQNDANAQLVPGVTTTAWPAVAPANTPDPVPGACNPSAQVASIEPAAPSMAPRLGLRVVWRTAAKIPVISDYWTRLPDGRILATYTPDELAWTLAIMGRDISADVIREKLGHLLRELPATGAGDLPQKHSSSDFYGPLIDPDADYWQAVMDQEAETLALTGEA